MPQEDKVAKAVSGAKSELAKATKLSSEADPTGAQKPKAPVTPVAPTKPAVSPKVGQGLGAELESKARNVTEYTNSVPKMHKGGEIQGDGLHVVNLEKGEKVTVEPKDEKEPKAEKVAEAKDPKAEKKEKKSSPSALMTSEDKAPKKDAKSAGKSDKKGGGFTETHVQHHSHGGHTVRHKHKDNPDKDVAYSAQDLEGVKQGLDQHIGGGAGQVMDAAEPPMAPEPAPQAAPPAGAMPQQV